MELVSVKFKENGKSYNFDRNGIELSVKDYVLLETEKGIQFGIVSNNNVKVDKSISTNEVKKVIRKANEFDYDKYLKNLKDANKALKDAKKIAVEYNIPMRLLDATYTFDRKYLIINFVADERIDFRNLAKSLASKYKSYIELHQVGIREKAREVGGVGACGLTLCCHSFKSDISSISISMAKRQNISLTPSKINGCCGRLLCCLSYEDDNYIKMMTELPKINENIDVDGNIGKVVKVDLLKKKVVVEVNGEEKVVDYDVK